MQSWSRKSQTIQNYTKQYKTHEAKGCATTKWKDPTHQVTLTILYWNTGVRKEVSSPIATCILMNYNMIALYSSTWCYQYVISLSTQIQTNYYTFKMLINIHKYSIIWTPINLKDNHEQSILYWVENMESTPLPFCNIRDHQGLCKDSTTIAANIRGQRKL